MYRKNRTQKRQLKKKNGYTLVCKIYANWCGHCQELAPKWAILKKGLPKNRFEFIEIEESESHKRTNFENRIKKQLKVNGYPTIFKIHPNGPIEYYSGERTPEDMKHWVLSSNKKSRKGFRHSRFHRRTQRQPKRWNGFL
jgi:thiol-disulfide isomerase/thioredoxin